MRSLTDQNKLLELELAMERAKIDILGISEIRRLGENIIKTKNGNIFYYKGETKGQKGVGFLISGSLERNIQEIKGYTERLATLEIKITPTRTLKVIQVYLPTITAKEEEIDQVYEQIQTVLNRNPPNYKQQIIIQGDFNSQIGERNSEEEGMMGKYSYGKRNGRGWRLIRFCLENKLKIMNTMYKKRMSDRWTWIAPNMESKTQIDYIIIPQEAKMITNCGTLQKFEFYSDHRPVSATLKIKKLKIRPRKEWNQSTRIGENIKEEKKEYRQKLESELDIPTETLKLKTLQEKYELLINKIKIVTKNLKRKRKEKNTGLSETTHQLIKKREQLKRKRKTKENKIELNLICKAVRNNIKEDLSKKYLERIKEIMTGNRSIKQIKKEFAIGKQWCVGLENMEKELKENRNEISKIAAGYYQNLYSKKIPENSGGPQNKQREISEAEARINNEEIPLIINSEVRRVINRLKNNKAGGPDEIVNENIKYGGENMVKLLTMIFNDVLLTESIPKDWKWSNIILLHKKGEKKKIENYRPISLCPTIQKIFTKTIELRIRNLLNAQQPKEQAGFRPHYSTIDHLHTINMIIEKSNEYQFKIFLAFIDYKKAFDMVEHEYMVTALKRQQIPQKITRIIQELYSGLQAKIITEKASKPIKIQRGVRQGDPLSPLLFNCVLEEVFKMLDWQEKGIDINGEKISNLRFADDVVLLAPTVEELRTMICELEEAGDKAGLEMNLQKTKILKTNEQNIDIEIKGNKIEVVENVIYLGQLISYQNKTTKEVNRRITLTWNKFWSLKGILKNRIPNNLKSAVFNMCLVPSLIYGSQTWAMTTKQKNRVRVTQNALERAILGINKRDRVRITKIKNQLKNNTDVLEKIYRQKWKWAGHLMRQMDDRWTKSCTNWYLSYMKRKKGRQLKRWDDDIVKITGSRVGTIRIAQNRRAWGSLEEAYARQGRIQ